MTVRISPLTADQAAPEVGALMATLPPLNILGLVAHAETAFGPAIELNATILSGLALPATVRELAILSVARLARCKYEWEQHVPIALGCGVTQTQIEAIEAGRLADASLSSAERAALRLVDEVMRCARASDDAVTEALEHFTARELVELVLSAGWYMVMAALMETAGIELEDPVGMGVVDAARNFRVPA